jgi:hypothetical protein
MRNVFFLCFFTLLGTCVSAQTIKGQLTDGASQEPMGFANVSVYDANDKLVKGTSSGIDGRYEIIDLPAGTYQLEASFLGYATETQTVSLTGRTRRDGARPGPEGLQRRKIHRRSGRQR